MRPSFSSQQGLGCDMPAMDRTVSGGIHALSVRTNQQGAQQALGKEHESID